MPALLEPADFDAWLDCRNVDIAEAVSLLRPAPDAMLSSTAVSPAVNNPRAEGPELLMPAAPKLI
jgi:putative SOS response-associated peptidase YedK